jgi:hypothetical protein
MNNRILKSHFSVALPAIALAVFFFLSGCKCPTCPKCPDCPVAGAGASTILLAGTVKEVVDDKGNAVGNTSILAYDPNDKLRNMGDCTDGSDGNYSKCSFNSSTLCETMIATTTTAGYLDAAYILAPDTNGNVTLPFKMHDPTYCKQDSLTVTLMPKVAGTNVTGYTIMVVPAAPKLASVTTKLAAGQTSAGFPLSNTIKSLYTIYVFDAGGFTVGKAWTFTTDNFSSSNAYKATIDCNYTW